LTTPTRPRRDEQSKKIQFLNILANSVGVGFCPNTGRRDADENCGQIDDCRRLTTIVNRDPIGVKSRINVTRHNFKKCVCLGFATNLSINFGILLLDPLPSVNIFDNLPRFNKFVQQFTIDIL